MTSADRRVVPGSGAILVSGDVLFGGDPADPRPLSDASTALERLHPIGQPVVLVGERIAGRMLKADPAERLAWVRTQLGSGDLPVVACDEETPIPSGGGTDRAHAERWAELRETWQAGWLITDHAAAVGPARRAGLTVIRIGPGDGSLAGSVERADPVVRDRLDAVRCVMTVDAFAARP